MVVNPFIRCYYNPCWCGSKSARCLWCHTFCRYSGSFIPSVWCLSIISWEKYLLARSDAYGKTRY